MKKFLKKHPVFIPPLYQLARLYWFFSRPKAHGSIVVFLSGGKVLMARHTYLPRQWTFPGGGRLGRESSAETAIREIAEELGISLTLGDLHYAGEFEMVHDFKRDTVAVFYVLSLDQAVLAPDVFEIVEARWFPLTVLPRLLPNARKAFDIALKAARANGIIIEPTE